MPKPAEKAVTLMEYRVLRRHRGLRRKFHAKYFIVALAVAALEFWALDAALRLRNQAQSRLLRRKPRGAGDSR